MFIAPKALKKFPPEVNGAKIRAVWDGSSSRRDRRIQKPRVLTLCSLNVQTEEPRRRGNKTFQTTLIFAPFHPEVYTQFLGGNKASLHGMNKYRLSAYATFAFLSVEHNWRSRGIPPNASLRATVK
jgi:hypothetical protein